MDSPVLRRKGIERELFSDELAELPQISWYQPTRDEGVEQTVAGVPRFRSTEDERLMFYRFNYCKMRLTELKQKMAKEGMTLKAAKEFLPWHDKLGHLREYLVRMNLALVLAMAKRTRL